MRRGVQFLCLMWMAAFYLLAAGYREDLDQNSQFISIQLENYFPSVQEAERIVQQEDRPEESSDCLFWGSMGIQSLENPDLHRSVSVECVGIYGEGSLYDGRIHTLWEEDVKGCILDEETAGQLFGTDNVVGKNILWQGKNYIVRQVLKTQERQVIFPADSKMQLSWVNVRGNGKDKEAEEFLMANNLQGRTVDGSFLAGILTWSLLVTALWLFARLCLELYRTIAREKQERRRGLYLAAMSLGICLFLGLLVGQLRVSADLVRIVKGKRGKDLPFLTGRKASPGDGETQKLWERDGMLSDFLSSWERPSAFPGGKRFPGQSSVPGNGRGRQAEREKINLSSSPLPFFLGFG